MIMNKMKLIYIDKQNWESNLSLFNVTNMFENYTHEFLNLKNVINLKLDSEDTTLATKAQLKNKIKDRVTKEPLDNITLVGFEFTLKEIFEDVMAIARECCIDIYIIDKSKYPIRSNVTMNIDLDEFDKETRFDDIKHILEGTLEDSLKNARKSKSPVLSTDLGVDFNEQSVFASEFFKSLLTEEEEKIIDLSDEELEKLIDGMEEQPLLMDPFLDKDADEFYCSYRLKDDLSIIKIDGEITISRNDESITLSLKDVKKIIKILEVMANGNE